MANGYRPDRPRQSAIFPATGANVEKLLPDLQNTIQQFRRAHQAATPGAAQRVSRRHVDDGRQAEARGACPRAAC